MDALRLVADWPVDHAAVAVLRRDSGGAVSVLGRTGPTGMTFPLASVTKPLAAYAALIAVEEGAFALDDPAGPAGATVEHLLAHASGLPFEGSTPLARPGTRRIYSNSGFDALAAALERASGVPFADYLAEAVFSPLGMAGATLAGSPAAAGAASLDDMCAFAAELLAPDLLAAETLARASAVAFPGLSGVLPGFGMRSPNDWGLGFELRGTKTPHWTGRTNSPATFGHFGRSGTFLWVDAPAGLACVCLTDREFGDWAREAWPALADGVIAEAVPTVPA